jgi:hypothetical protein
MDINPTLSISLSRYIYNLAKDFEYSWNVSENAWKCLDVGFDHEIYTESKTEQVKALKEHISKRWEYANGVEKNSLAKWIIGQWGGIKGNKTETILKHIKRVDAPNLETPIEGIASYSKLLAFKDPKKYAIYDARVAAALNAVQLLILCEGKIAFPYIPGRNTKIQGTKDEPGFVLKVPVKFLEERGFTRLKKDETYSTYLLLLKAIAHHLPNFEIGDIELILFSKAEDICKKALKNL